MDINIFIEKFLSKKAAEVNKYNKVEDLLKLGKDDKCFSKKDRETLSFILELNKNLWRSHRVTEKTQISSKSELLSFLYSKIAMLKEAIGYENRENFFIMYLDSANQIIKEDILFKGTIDRSAIYPREIMEEILKFSTEEYNNEVEINPLKNSVNIMKRCLLNKCKSIIIAHNHPSGNYKPSRSDIELTQSLKVTLGMVDIRLLDHMIITKESYYSFLEEGLMD